MKGISILDMVVCTMQLTYIIPYGYVCDAVRGFYKLLSKEACNAR